MVRVRGWLLHSLDFKHSTGGFFFQKEGVDKGVDKL